MPTYTDETVNSIPQIWANKYLMSRRPLPVPTGEVDVREANAAAHALLELAKSAAAKLLRETAPNDPPRQPTLDEIRDTAAAIAVEVLKATESQARVDRTLLSNLQT